MAVSKRTKRKIGNIVYGCFLAFYACVLIVVAARVLIDWNKYLGAYEASRPDAVVEAYMDNFKSTMWQSEVLNAVSTMNHPFQTNEECQVVINKMLGDTIQYKRDNAKSSTTSSVYNVYCNGNTVGNFRVDQDMSKINRIDIGIFEYLFDRRSLCPWTVTEDNVDITNFKFTSSTSITVPESYSVQLNGRTVGPEYIVERGIQYDILKSYYEDYPNLPTKVTYAVNDQIFGTLEFAVMDQKGNPVTIDKDKDDSQFIEECPADERTEIEQFALSFAEPYARFTGIRSLGSTYPELKRFVKDGSDLAKRMDLFVEGGADYMNFYAVNVANQRVNSVYSLGGGFYVASLSYDTTNYAEYKTVEESNTKKIIVCKDATGIFAVSVE